MVDTLPDLHSSGRVDNAKVGSMQIGRGSIFAGRAVYAAKAKTAAAKFVRCGAGRPNERFHADRAGGPVVNHPG